MDNVGWAQVCIWKKNRYLTSQIHLITFPRICMENENQVVMNDVYFYILQGKPYLCCENRYVPIYIWDLYSNASTTSFSISRKLSQHTASSRANLEHGIQHGVTHHGIYSQLWSHTQGFHITSIRRSLWSKGWTRDGQCFASSWRHL